MKITLLVVVMHQMFAWKTCPLKTMFSPFFENTFFGIKVGQVQNTRAFSG